MQPIGVFGGEFDPIHNGHLRTAFELWQELHLTEVRILPTGSPPHRDPPYASAELRLQMVRAAIAEQPAFVVDDREVSRGGLPAGVRCARPLGPSRWFLLFGRYAHRDAGRVSGPLVVSAARHGRLP